MNNAIKIKDNIYWIGVNDRRTHIFENYWPLPKGVAYNSYVIVDEKVVVIDTVERSRMDDYLDSLQAVLQGRKVDYLIINHMEPDHTGAIKNLLCHYPDLTVVGNCKTFPMLQNYYGVDSNLLEVKEGDSLNIGKRTLNFYMVPMLHWPETMVTYLPGENIVFAGMCSELSEPWTVVFSMTRSIWITWKRKSAVIIRISSGNTVCRHKQP